jgi:hypothetical protein
MSIYKITGYGLVYYGSTTTDLKKRLYQHKATYKQYLLGKCRRVSVYKIFELGNECNIDLVEEVDNIDELTKKEGFYIKNNECINKVVAGRNNKEYYKDKKIIISQYQKEYYLNNKDKYKKYYINKKKKNQLQKIENNNNK